jgi:hypothetical protein
MKLSHREWRESLASTEANSSRRTIFAEPPPAEDRKAVVVPGELTMG